MSAIKECSEDGEVGCKTTDSFKSAEVSQISEGDLLTGKSTGTGNYGVTGSEFVPSYSPDFPDASNVLSTDTVNGSSGTLTLPLASNVRTTIVNR